MLVLFETAAGYAIFKVTFSNQKVLVIVWSWKLIFALTQKVVEWEEAARDGELVLGLWDARESKQTVIWFDVAKKIMIKFKFWYFKWLKI